MTVATEDPAGVLEPQNPSDAIEPTAVWAPGIEIPAEFGGIPVRQVKRLRPYVKGMVFGAPGAGKTWWVSQCAKIPAMSPVAYMTSDDTEADTLYKAAPEAHHLKITKWSQFWDIYNMAAKGIRDPSLIPFRTFVIDTGTEAERMWMHDIMEDLVAKGVRPGGGEINIDVPSVREWGQSTSGMRRLIRAYRDLPVNFFVTAHQKTERDNSGTMWTRPDFPGKLANQASGMFPNVWYIYVKADQEDALVQGKVRKVTTFEHRMLLTGFTEGFPCKTRAGTLPRLIENPPMGRIFELITGRNQLTGETLPVLNEQSQQKQLTE